MKILFHSADKSEIYNARFLLAAKGVPTYIGSENSGPAPGFAFANKYTLWVCMESQYDDAQAVLNDPEYEVKEPVDMEEFQRYVDSSVVDIEKSLLDKAILAILVTLAGIIALVFVVRFGFR